MHPHFYYVLLIGLQISHANIFMHLQDESIYLMHLSLRVLFGQGKGPMCAVPVDTSLLFSVDHSSRSWINDTISLLPLLRIYSFSFT